MSDSSRDESDCDEKASGYCHFNESGSNTFNINIFGYELRINQLPSSRNLGHGAVVWDAAVVFAKYMENSPSLFNLTSLGEKRVLELGSGCGLAGIAMMMKGAYLTMTDLPDVVEQLTLRNALNSYDKLRSLGDVGYQLHKPVVVPLDWTDNTGGAIEGQCFDMILLTDCIFSVYLATPIVATLLRHSSNRTEIWCCHEIRDVDANREFVRQMKNHFVTKRIPVAKLHPEYSSEKIEIFVAKLKRKKHNSYL